MDAKKKAEFVRKMGKKKKRLPRKRFADGGATTLGGPTDSGTQQNATNPNTGLMGNINAALGLNNNYQATGANVQSGTNTAQLNNSYTGAQNAIGNQQDLVNQFMPSVGSAVNNQNALANQYLAMTQGQGPNPALNQLNQTTAQNVANQTAMMAGQRGASSNAGLMARQAAQQGAQTQQQAAGQAATLEAQQQIAAQDKLQNLAANQISQAGQAVTGLNSAQQNEQSILQNANTSYNNASVGMQSNINNNNAQTSAANQNMAANTLGGIMSMGSSVMNMFAKGGQVHHKIAEMNAQSMLHLHKMADGGELEDDGDLNDDASSDNPDLGSFKASTDQASTPNVSATPSLPADQTNLAAAASGKAGGGGGGGGGLGAMAGLAMMAAQGGEVNLGKASFSPGSASNGPSISGGGGLPTNTTNFSNVVQNAMSKKSNDSSSSNQSDEDAQQGYLDADAMLGNGPEEGASLSQDDDGNFSGSTNAVNDNVGMLAAHGGMAWKPGHFARYFAKGGDVPAMVSPGEIYLSPEQVQQVVHNDVDPKDIGHKFKGKAKVKGDSYENDTIPTTLKEGGVVIDREHMGTKDKRKLFVHKAIAKKKAGGKL